MANQTPELRNQLLVHLASHVTCQLSTDVAQSVLAGFVAAEVVSREHRTTSGDGRELSGSFGLLASVVAGLVQAPAVAGVDALLDVVQRCEEGNFHADAGDVVQDSVRAQDAAGDESRVLEDLFRQVGSEWCARRETSDAADVT